MCQFPLLCFCRGDLITMLSKLHKRNINFVIIETTGLADPGKI